MKIKMVTITVVIIIHRYVFVKLSFFNQTFLDSEDGYVGELGRVSAHLTIPTLGKGRQEDGKVTVILTIYRIQGQPGLHETIS